MGIAVRYLGKPLYVSSDYYKFARLFLLDQSDLTEMGLGDGLSFLGKTIWDITRVVVGTRP